ncbi:RNA polymerase sigma-70 factor, ECF subfamily [Chitinophaga sp. CF118]|uniref:RNA polymerase sigma-70 factor n=1 Tax=Chitinophaga sp. CF118 TaxID=1884367 RepID=UPI0008E9643E|nr:RNA polymerase sigma-70 factor [Chitinophaga sp. CF118]SFE80534.1 RNA polymerase sigma-70 factor, ECF subfamily [Chitinophaga sp. CF118]
MSSSANIRIWQQQIACHGDEKAFAELFRYFYDRLLHFCIQYVHTREAAEEIVSDVFVKIWNRRTELEQVANLEVYLFVAIKNHSLNYLEQYSSLRITPINDETGIAQLTNSVDPERTMEWKEILFRMDQEVSRLPDQCRRVFKLIKEEGFKYKDVAEILNISPRTVETQLFRAMKRLNEVVGPYMFNRVKNKEQ